MSLHPSNTIIVYILIFVNDYFSIFTMKECISHAKHGRFPHRNNISIIYVYICFSTPFACLFEYISYSTKNMQNITRGKCQENTIEFLEKIFLTSFKSKFRVVILTSWCEKYSTTYTTYKNTRLRYIS